MGNTTAKDESDGDLFSFIQKTLAPKQTASPVTVERYDYDRVSSTISSSRTSIHQGKLHCLARLWWNVSSVQQDRYLTAVGANCLTT